MNVRRSPGVVMISPWIRPRPDRGEAVPTVRICHDAACTSEIGIDRRIPSVAGVDVATRCIGLPDFHDGIGNGSPALIQNPTRHHDALTDRRALVLRCEVRKGRAHQTAPAS